MVADLPEGYRCGSCTQYGFTPSLTRVDGGCRLWCRIPCIACPRRRRFLRGVLLLLLRAQIQQDIAQCYESIAGAALGDRRA